MVNYEGFSLKYFVVNVGSFLWISMGLYVVLGAIIIVIIFDLVVDGGLCVFIGVYTDKFWNKDEWRRYFEIMWVYVLKI